MSCAEGNTQAYFETATVEDVTACLDAGVTPLHWAAFRNPNPAVIEALIAAGAILNVRDEEGVMGTNPLGVLRMRAMSGGNRFLELCAGVHRESERAGRGIVTACRPRRNGSTRRGGGRRGTAMGTSTRSRGTETTAGIARIRWVRRCRMHGGFKTCWGTFMSRKRVPASEERALEILQGFGTAPRSPGPEIQFSNNGPFGEWSDPVFFPAGQYVCRLRPSVEGRVGWRG